VALHGPLLMREERMAKIKIYDKKFNSLSRTYFFKCIISECDFTLPFNANILKNVTRDEHLEIAKARDSFFIDHLRVAHAFEFMAIPSYEKNKKEDENDK